MILGFDPGYAITGWGALEKKNNRLIVRGAGSLETPAFDPMPLRLASIHAGVASLLTEYNPAACVVECLFFARNQKTAAGVYQARGVILSAIGAAQIQVIELTPSAIKQAITGSGRADKKDVMRMVRSLLGITTARDDTADALAGAIAGLSYVQGSALAGRT